MFSNISTLLFSDNPKWLAGFYTKVLGKDPDWSGGDFVGWMIGPTGFAIGPHDKVHGKNQSPERSFLNLETDDVAGEFARIKKLGAKVIQEPYNPEEAKDMWVSTFADPDGNYFQVVSPFKAE